MRIQEFNGFKTDLLQSVLWQYNQATSLLSLLNQKQAWYDLYQTQFWNDWYNNIFNLSSPTLNYFGCTVWSIILNIPLYIPLIPPPDPVDFPVWGFNAYNPSFPTLLNNNQDFSATAGVDYYGNFYPVSDIFLTIPQQQFLLRLRYFQLSNLGDIVDINTFLRYLCVDNLVGYTGTIYILDNLNMTATYQFTNSDFPDDLFDAITQLDVWPRPAGISLTFEGN